MQLTILSISGKPGLYKLVARGKANLIVEAIDSSHKRMPTFATDRVVSLADITMYGADDDVPLMKILCDMRDKEGAAPASLNFRKASPAELHEYLSAILPGYDRDRVHDSDIRRLIQWYNILVENGITNFEEAMKPTEGDNIADRL